uniref:Uncharacterized protein n=1 Tax=viral metagenome TaxID=1070528 RepID=A0A6C0L044_9ZZZZ|tara:strand:- start:6708 stop:7673 length:966 start_codon:yes stop_codon:yes gene_type:complete
MIVLYILILVSIYFLLVSKKNLGYLETHFKNKTINKISTTNYIYSIQSANTLKQKHMFPKIFDFQEELPPNSYICIAKSTKQEHINTCVGKLALIPWKIPTKTFSNTLYIGNHLEVLYEHRNYGVANQIISKSVKKLSSQGGFGMFSTNFELSIPQNKVYQIYWTKQKPNLNLCSICSNLIKINFNQISFDNYPNHPWLNVPLKQRKTYLKYLESTNIHFFQLKIDNKAIIIAVQSIIDSYNHKVSNIKWFWGNKSYVQQESSLYSITKILGDDYISIPTINKPKNTNIWDKSICYFYVKPEKINFKSLTDSNIYGWFLDR